MSLKYELPLSSEDGTIFKVFYRERRTLSRLLKGLEAAKDERE